MKKSAVVIFALAMAVIACSPRSYEKTSRGIIVTNGKNSLIVQVMKPGIIRVFASPGTDIPRKESLVVTENFETEGSWEVAEDTLAVSLTTQNLQVKINKKTLAVTFLDREGKVLLAEKNGGGKSFSRIQLPDDSTWAVRQQFELSPDEAIYGLGQHQDRTLNLRGKVLSLFQHNREIFVPVVVSTNGYGLLWDNYSWTRFGSLEPSPRIPSECWADKYGKTGGLTATYFTDRYCKIPSPIKSKQPVRPFDLPEAGKDNIMSMRLEGTLTVPETGEYQFENTGQQEFRFWLNGKPVRDYWSAFLKATDYTRLTLEKGVAYTVKMEWGRSSASETMDLAWRTPSMRDDTLSFWSQAGKGIDYYFIYGPSMDEVIAGYRKLTGDAPMMPRWAYGFWQCRERYKSQEEVLATVNEFRKRKVPLDVIVQDWRYWKDDQWGSHEFDSTRYPDPRGMTDSLHAMNARIMISVWAKFYPTTKNYQELNEKGFLYPYNIVHHSRDFLGNLFAYYDAYNPEARKIYWEQIKRNLFDAGIDAWWLDATEPEVGENIPPENMAERMHPNYFGSGWEYLNAYPLFTCRGIYENQRKTAPDQRVCILSRSAFAGQQRYAATSWSGDIVGRWETFRAQIPAGLSFSVSGIPYWTTDIGGFMVDYPGGNANPEYKELFTRWYQFGVFCPVFRVHGTSTPREIWFFGNPGDPWYDVQLAMNKLRYRLFPYNYSVAADVSRNGYTMMRPLAMDFTNDKTALNIDDQYMFGPALLVSPVTQYQTYSKSLYLPEWSGWYDFWTGIFFKGGMSIQVPAPLDIIPVFARAGAILPLGPQKQYTGEKPSDPLQLMVYTGADGTFVLYEDDGLTYKYEQGEFSLIPFRWNEKGKTLEIGDRSGTFDGMPGQRTIEVHLVSPDHPCGYNQMTRPDTTVTYNGKRMVLSF